MPNYSIFFSIFMGAAILASAFMVLELAALVIYDGIKKFLTRVRRGNGPGGGEWAASLNVH